MFSTLRTRFGIPGVISVMALVFAMFGGAYAASNSSDGGGKATASAKAKKGPRGPKGAKGDTGPAGPAGPQGPAGAKGDAGANGSNGQDGSAGASVTSTPVATGVAGECNKLGGTKFTVDSGTPTFACNGAKGAAGPTCNENGECLLPSQATETGNWAVASHGQSLALTAISFPLRLSAAPVIHYVTSEQAEEDEVLECPGEAATPEAEPGNLCIYEGAYSVVGGGGYVIPTPEEITFVTSDPKSGVTLGFGVEAAHLEEQLSGRGSWAVTAP